MKVNIIASLSAIIFLSGCNAVITDFVKGTKPTNIDQPSSIESGPMAIKVSPGHVRAVSTGNPGAMEATITPTNRSFSAGNDMSAQITLGRTRVHVE